MPPQSKGKLAVFLNCINFYIYTHGAMWCFTLSHFNGLWFWAFYLHQNTLYGRILMVITWWNIEIACRHLHQERHDTHLSKGQIQMSWTNTLLTCRYSTWTISTWQWKWHQDEGAVMIKRLIWLALLLQQAVGPEDMIRRGRENIMRTIKRE